MPSRYSHVVTSPMASLSEIIELEPEEEPWCAGYAPSQGRRCHARTNARGRSTAMMLLNEGTKDLRAGRNIDTLLEDLAPYVLCTRFHQSQAWDLARRWKRQVRTYLDSQVVSTRYTRPVRTPSRVISQTAEANMEERIAVLQQRLREAKEEVRRLKVAQSGLPVTTNPSHREGRNMSAVGNSSTAGRASSGNPPVNRVNETLRRDLTESSTNQSTINVPRPVQAQASRQTTNVPRPVQAQATRQTTNVPRPVQAQANQSTINVPRPVQAQASRQTTNAPQPVQAQASRQTTNVPRPVQVQTSRRTTSVSISSPRPVNTPTVARASGRIGNTDSQRRISQPNRREIEGECGICLCNLHSSQDEDWDEEEESENSGGEDHADDDQDDDDDDDTDDEEHPEELVWCKARCGVNFHKKCIDQWLETNHASTCPTCRSNWKH